jgi:MFS family permease
MPPAAPPLAPPFPAAPPVRRAAIAVAVAAAAMVATLPGRTHGLGLVTEPLLADLRLDRVGFATLNFWATVIGAAFCIPAGWLLDRFGVRAVLAGVLLALGAVVVGMSRVPAGGGAVSLPVPEVFFAGGLEWAAAPVLLLALVLLTRGLGQSGLSVVSLALVGKAAGRRPGVAMGVYSVLTTVGFTAAFVAVRAADQAGVGWRDLWAGIGWVVVAAGVLAALAVRNPPAEPESSPAEPAGGGATLGAAVRSPAFWVFALGTSFYGMVSAGLSLFNQSVLAERGFDRDVFLTITAIGLPVGLVANLLTGWLATRVRLGFVLAGGLALLAAALFAYRHVTTQGEVYAFACAHAAAGGVIMVTFFTVWRQAYGTAHLGKIQGAAQLLTVVASAAGPVLFAVGQRSFGSYTPLMENLAWASAAFAAAALVVPTPGQEPTT